MASDDSDEHRVDDGDRNPEGDDERTEDATYGIGDDDFEVSTAFDDSGESVAGTAVEEVDQRIVDLLSWILDTETRAKIYVYLLANPGSTSEEVAKGTGLYPSTVREALAELHEEDRVLREKRESEGAGNNPYEYTAIQPSELVGGVVDQVQHELNTIFTLDRVLDRRDPDDAFDDDVEPVTITVDDVSDSSGPSDSDSGASDLESADLDATDGDEADADVEDDADETDEE